MSKNIQVPQGWEVKKLGEVVEINNTRVLSEQLEPLSISAGIGFVNQTEKFGRDLAGKQYEKYIKIKKYDFAYNKGNSKKYPQGCIYLLKDREHAAIPNVFECFRIKNYNCFYYEQLFISGFLNKQLYRLINAGVRNDGLLNLNSENFYSCYIPVPPLEEQKKIAEILSLWDKAIEQTKELIAYKEKQKKGLMQALLTGKKRLNGFTDEWKTVKLGEVFNYEQPNNYIVKNNDYEKYGIPVLTANKSFILGYTNENFGIYKNIPVIIFDDFTTDKKYINFPFKIKSSAIKILSAKSGNNIKFLYEFMTMIKFSPQDHKRYYISTYQHIEICIPTLTEQEAIADILSSADKEIELLNKQLELYTEQKKGLMQNLLTGKVRV